MDLMKRQPGDMDCSDCPMHIHNPRKPGAKNPEKDEEKKKMEKVMQEFKEGKLMSSNGRTVTSRKQAVAIGLSQSRKTKKKIIHGEESD